MMQNSSLMETSCNERLDENDANEKDVVFEALWAIEEVEN